MFRFLIAITFALVGMASNPVLVFADEQVERAADVAIIEAYRLASDGYSADEVLINDDLRERWLAAVASDWQSHSDNWRTETSLRLLSLRKAGKLPAIASKRGRAVVDEVLPIAEIAARGVIDEHQVSTDRLLCSAILRDQLQAHATRISPSIDPYDVRKAVLRLRKTRHLRPELTLRVADWKRTIEILTSEELAKQLQEDGRISHGAGVYLFRDASGYLYIGEASNLHQRLTQHLNDSDRRSLKDYLDSVAEGSVTVELHLFDSDSPANDLSIRRAYESEMIRTREPRLNVRP